MRVLVTGGAGFIGSHTAYAIAQAGHVPVVIDNLSTGFRDAVKFGPFHECDIADKTRVDRVLREEKIESIVHFAGKIAVGESVQNPSLYFDENVSKTIRLLDCARDAGIRSVVFSSSAAVYGLPAVTPIVEETLRAPINPYGHSKSMVETILATYASAYGFRYIALRYFNAAGECAEQGLRERHDPETHLVPLAVRALRTGTPLSLFGDDYDTPDGTAIRDYVHVLDLADAHVRSIEHLAHHDSCAEAVNLGSGTGYSVREVVDAVTQVHGRPVPHTIGPRRAGDPPRLIADASKAKALLQWVPSRGLSQMIPAL